MNPLHQLLLDKLHHAENLTAEQKDLLLKSLKEDDKNQNQLQFKLDRIEKDRRTLQVMLEESIDDLQKKNKVLEIEASLERVRSVAMSMKKPEDMLDVCRMISDQLQQLGFKEVRNVQTLIIYEQKHEYLNYQYFAPYDKNSIEQIDYRFHPVEKELAEKMLKGGDSYYSKVFKGEELRVWREHRKKTNQLPDPKLDEVSFAYYYFYSIGPGALGVTAYTELSEEQISLFKRFRNVFELSYRRFLDIEKAIQQAREAQIEAALERVRSKAMAMQKSEDLANAVAIVFEELDKLNLGALRCGIGILDKEKRTADVWTTTMADNNTVVQVSGDESMDIHPLLQGAFNAWLKQEDFNYVLKGKDLNDYYKALTGVNFKLPASQSLVSGIEEIEQYHFNAIFPAGGLFAFRETPFPEEAKAVMKRFADVFNLTYTRFNDLKQAEAQAHEAKIQLALERVRARTMAMQKSDELREVVALLLNQMKAFGSDAFMSMLVLYDRKSKGYEVLMSSDDQSVFPQSYQVPYFADPFRDKFLEAFDEGVPYKVFDFGGEEKRAFDKLFFTVTDFSTLPEETKKAMIAIERCQLCCAFMEYGCIEAIGPEALSNENAIILQRFTKVFEQTYTRFLDLQRAEAQTREAQIENALEKVRSRSLAMHKSGELLEVIKVVFDRLMELDVVTDTVSILIPNADFQEVDFWIANREQTYSTSVRANFGNFSMGREVFEAWRCGSDFFSKQFSFEEKNAWWTYAFEHTGFKVIPGDRKKMILESQHFAVSIALSKNILIQCTSYSNILLTNEQAEVVKRFAKVFDQAYTRFLDLQKAETQALEAIKRASVDRVRAEIASMRTTSDLERITPLIWNELTTLGVPFIRCGVFIMDEEGQQVHTFLSTPEGKAIAILHVPFEFNLALIKNGVDHWRKKKTYQEHWDAPAFTNAWITLSALRENSANSPQHELPPENLYLHLLPFLQGMLYVGNEVPLDEVELQLVQNLADAFATAYARYEDFNKLESAKIQIEKTLVDLKQTQAQLVQSEKMASLGELTAGIAHEIQNPLNFVNNFSEVSNELIDEMVEAVKKGNYEDANAIANDVRQNLEKILHHGKRADGIVKGMLQHSRSSSAVKEPTDINRLADEYLRLAYHGLRAKDKSFNAKFETDLDPGVGKVNVIPQDIGRVILNLITNAFYTVTEKKKSTFAEASVDKQYEPTVTVGTKKIDNVVLISVKDNGNGIPKKVLDKIFQPFFTTKPTGQGTGLGLSLSFDIVKAHGGELKVETKEGEGATFIIILPNS
jgi:signal transduction histidine kinase